MNKFQLIILVVFLALAGLGIFFFATFRGGTSVEDIALTIWGSDDKQDIDNFLGEFRKNTNRSFNVSYTQVEGSDFAGQVVEAIADGREPDIVIISAGDIFRFEDKILTIPFESISERSFRDAFIEGGEIFLSKDGILGLPLMVDPMVTYWNRDILQSAGFASPPEFWSELFGFSMRITDRDNAQNITRSAVALGEYENIENAKEIIISMMLQNNNPIISRNDIRGTPDVVFADDVDGVTPSAESVLKFYTEFSNPTKISYSWNRSLPNSLDAFTSEDLGLYFGFASELDEIKKKNPNLNFDVATFLQPSEGSNRKVYGDIKALVVLKRSKNPNVAVSAISSLIRDDNIKALSSITGLPPVKRTLLANPPGLAYEDLFYKSALIAGTFLDPDPEKTDEIFQNLIERIVSGRERIDPAVSRAASEFNILVKER
jgi:ABC-type glycerol-3-phosphate transport system substrate-binding protein